MQFELRTGAHFAFASLPELHLPEEEEDSDLTFAFEGAQFFVEAKRPQSEAAIPGAVRDAVRQLKRRLDATELVASGLAAVSATKVLNPGRPVWPR